MTTLTVPSRLITRVRFLNAHPSAGLSFSASDANSSLPALFASTTV